MMTHKGVTELLFTSDGIHHLEQAIGMLPDDGEWQQWECVFVEGERATLAQRNTAAVMLMVAASHFDHFAVLVTVNFQEDPDAALAKLKEVQVSALCIIIAMATGTRVCVHVCIRVTVHPWHLIWCRRAVFYTANGTCPGDVMLLKLTSK